MRIRAIPIMAFFTFGVVYAAPPGEVPANAAFQADKTTFSWSAVAGADAYNVYRGSDPSAYDHTCRVYRAASASASLPETPASPGALLYFLVSGVNADGEGLLGRAGDGSPIPNAEPCADSDGDLVPDNLDNCPGAPNASQEDQDLNGVGDRCDPNTYDFETDTIGQRPADMVQLGGTNATFEVKDIGGEHGVAYDTGSGQHDRFERLLAGMPFQDTTAYVDFVEGVQEVCSIELWSEGAYGWNAGGGAILQVSASGGLVFYDRYGQQVPSTQGPAAPPGGRMRLRLIKGAGTTSTLHVDSWDGASFVPDWAIFQVADDHRYRGLGTVLADYLGGRRGLRRVTLVHEVPAGALVLRKDPGGSSDWKVFQRDAQDRATIPVRFYYRLDGPGRVQVRVVDSGTGGVLPGHDWADHEQALAPADPGSGELGVVAVPTGGNYDLEVRLVRDADGVVLGQGAVSEVAVGDVYIAAGQSNMSGYSGTLAGAETPIDPVHLFHNDYTWKRAAEPMDDGTDQVDRVSQESPLHSLMLSFAKNVHQAAGVPIGVIPGPLGGTNLYSQWQRDAADHGNRGTLYGSMLHRALAQGYPAPVKGFLWFQGESDAGRGTAAYKTDLKRLISQYREDLGDPSLPFFIAQLGTYDFSNLTDWLAIQEAQRQVVEEDAKTALVTTVDQPRSDTIHFSVQGYKTIGVRFAEAARELLYGEAINALIRLLDARASSNGGAVELVYEDAVTGGSTSLYAVRDSSGIRQIVSISISGNIVALDVQGKLKPNALVTYGLSRSPNALWVEDARGTPVATFQDVPVTP